jgi:hypothetical protein
MAESSAFDAALNEIISQLMRDLDDVVALIQRPFTAIGGATLSQAEANTNTVFGDGNQAVA